jgi:hypothetical protein
MTPAIKSAMRVITDCGKCPTEMQWFDISSSFSSQIIKFNKTLLLNYRPPFKKSVIVLTFHTKTFITIVLGDNPEDTINLCVIQIDGENFSTALLGYAISDGEFKIGPLLKEDFIDQKYMKLVALIVSNWFQALEQGVATYRPYVRPTIINQRKIAKGQTPKYDWKTVYLKPVKPRSEPKGGTHASPRLHDRRGHLRRLRNGRSVWVKPCKVGDASKGAVWHDYSIRKSAPHYANPIKTR